VNKAEIQAYFDRQAPEWDARMVRCTQKINAILAAAAVGPGTRVLDVACGTGVLFEDYLAHGVAEVVGVDISPEMVRIARRKYPQSHVSVLCADVEEISFAQPFDSVVVYNAFPHFTNPAQLVAHLAGLLAPGGSLCIAHGMSRQALLRHHEGRPSTVSQPLPELQQVTALLHPYFRVSTAVSDEEKFIAAGVRLPG